MRSNFPPVNAFCIAHWFSVSLSSAPTSSPTLTYVHQGESRFPCYSGIMPVPSRPNTTLAYLVERFIAIADTDHDRVVAAMIAAHVPDRVIARVLCEPRQRRSAPIPSS